MGLALVLAHPLSLLPLRGDEEPVGEAGARRGMRDCPSLSAVGTYSRGTFLAILAMGFWLWWKSRHKLLLGVALVAHGAAAASRSCPEKWEDRMRSITEYQQDSSAMGRLNAWQTAINVARDHPLVGGGFEFHSQAVFARYAPVPEDFHSMHSIYFQVLGEHGFVGLALFLAIWFFTWLRSMRLARMTKGQGGPALGEQSRPDGTGQPRGLSRRRCFPGPSLLGPSVLRARHTDHHTRRRPQNTARAYRSRARSHAGASGETRSRRIARSRRSKRALGKVDRNVAMSHWLVAQILGTAAESTIPPFGSLLCASPTGRIKTT